MLSLFPRSTNQEQSRKGSLPLARARNLWLLATIAGLALIVAIASSPVLAASSNSTVPTLKVVPKNIGIPGDGTNCKGILRNRISVCHVTLTETKSSNAPLHWFTHSDFPAKFGPPSGNLTPGQSVQVTIITKFCGGYTNFYFVGPKNVASVRFACG